MSDAMLDDLAIDLGGIIVKKDFSVFVRKGSTRWGVAALKDIVLSCISESPGMTYEELHSRFESAIGGNVKILMFMILLGDLYRSKSYTTKTINPGDPYKWSPVVILFPARKDS